MLPSLNSELLSRWRIPSELHQELLACRTEDDLLNLPIEQKYLERVLDNLYPRDLAEIATQPEFMLGEAENIERLAEEDLSSFLLRLSPEQEQMVQIDKRGPLMVRGGPGTGKSTLALYRIKYLRDAGVERLLFTTFTNALVSYSEQLLGHLLQAEPRSQGVSLLTVDALARNWYIQAKGRSPNYATEGQASDLLERALEEADLGAANSFERAVRQQQLKRLGSQYLLEEIHSVILAWPLESLEEYLQADRRGRAHAMRASMREAFWSVYQRWLLLMEEAGVVTNGLVRYEAFKAAQASQHKPYQALIIDEAQDLMPLAIRFLLALVDSYDHVYITADAAQSIYERGFSWKQVDGALDMRGRSMLLKRNYRNTQQIITACAQILQAYSSDFDHETLYPEAAVHSGERPMIAFYNQSQPKQQAQQIYAFFKDAAQRYHLPVHSSAVLCANRKQAVQMANILTEIGCPAQFQSGKDVNIRAKVVKVLTMHSAKGLEFPVVAVVGLQQGVVPPQFAHYPAEEQAALEASYRRLFFVACSRAMRALLVCASQQSPSPFIENLTSDDWNWSHSYA